MPSKKTVPQTRRATTFKASPVRRVLDTLRTLAASWRTSGATFQRQILNGLQDKPVYQGTANPRKVAKRRAANRVARRSRRINRQRARR